MKLESINFDFTVGLTVGLTVQIQVQISRIAVNKLIETQLEIYFRILNRSPLKRIIKTK